MNNKKFLFSGLLLLVWGMILGAEPIFFLTARSTSGGLYTLNTSTKVVSKIAAGADFMSIERYGTDQMLVSSYGTNQLYIFNQNGTTARVLNLGYSPLGAIEQKNGSGNIYYADYFGSAVRLYNVTNNTDSQLYDVSNSRSYGILQRSNGDLYLSESDIKKAATNTSIYSGVTNPYSVTVDEYDNFFAPSGRNTIIKINSSNVSSTFWSDASISMYNFTYDEVSDKFYGIGYANGQYNMYQFTTSGVASIYLSNISGFWAYGEFDDLVVFNSSSYTVPEPSTFLLCVLAVLGGSLIRQRAILR